MLMHAYKSVFRAAWLKGMASAVVLTAGLSAQTAQTAEDHSFHGFMTYITEGWSLPSGEGSSKVTALDTEQMAALIKALAPQESTSQLENAGGEFNASSVQSSLQSGGIFTYLKSAKC